MATFSICRFGLFLIIGVCLSKNVFSQDDEKVPFTLEEILSRNFTASDWNGTWVTNTSFLYENSDGDYYKFDVNEKTSELFLNGSFLENYPGASISLSPDQTYVLISYNISAVYRHSTTAVYTIYDIANDAYYDINNQTTVQLVTFDTIGHAFAYVYLNNIYFVSDVSAISSPVQVTQDGVQEVIFNGVPDWVYEEEILQSASALWFSPDGNNLAYAKFNGTSVKDFYYILYGTPGDLADQYPTLKRIKYPKSGTPNPLVSTYVYNIETEETTQFELIDSIQNTEENNDYVLYGITWISSSELAMTSTNRVQNESVIIRCQLDGTCSEEVSHQQEDGWLIYLIPTYNKDGTLRLEILPQPYEDDYFNHLVITNISTNTSTRLTYGNREVTSIYGWDETNNLVYYLSSVNDTPSQQQVSVVNTETTEDTCLTCEFVVDDEYCQYASASFNQIFTYFIKICQGPNPDYTVIQSLSNDSDVYVWNANLEIREQLESKLRFSLRDIQVPLSSNFTARVLLLLPPNFNESLSYPAVVEVYAGPNSNSIDARYYQGITNYLVTNETYIYIFIDGRGSGRDGLNKVFQMYRKLGTVEIEDQIEVTKYLQDNYSFIDRNRTGIWGWSYGGFATTWALIKDTENVFKFGLAVAPVTNYFYYASMWTEMYMGLPTADDNFIGYNNTDITTNVEALRGKLYMVIHGSGDDNVHYQNTMILAKALEAADIAFSQQSYTDEQHSLVDVFPHLYHSIFAFFARAVDTECE